MFRCITFVRHSSSVGLGLWMESRIQYSVLTCLPFCVGRLRIFKNTQASVEIGKVALFARLLGFYARCDGSSQKNIQLNNCPWVSVPQFQFIHSFNTGYATEWSAWRNFPAQQHPKWPNYVEPPVHGNRIKSFVPKVSENDGEEAGI